MLYPMNFRDPSAFETGKSTTRIAPMPLESNPRDSQRRGRRGLIRCLLVILVLIPSLIWGLPQFADLVLDRIERQRAAQDAYNCEHYGAAMNKYYGREVCEESALYQR